MVEHVKDSGPHPTVGEDIFFFLHDSKANKALVFPSSMRKLGDKIGVNKSDWFSQI